MKKIYLGRKKDKFALVDNEDYERLTSYKWKWWLDRRGHVTMSVPIGKEKYFKRKTVQMHSLIMNPSANMGISHVNGNKLDNRKSNLRIATMSQIMMSARSYSNNTTGYRGVTYHKQNRKWMAQIVRNKKHFFLGLYDAPRGAALAYDRKAKELFGEFASLNF